jgi:hypothetical protein
MPEVARGLVAGLVAGGDGRLCALVAPASAAAGDLAVTAPNEAALDAVRGGPPGRLRRGAVP